MSKTAGFVSFRNIFFELVWLIEYGENIIKAKLNLKNPLIVSNYDEVAKIAGVEAKRPKGMNDRKIWSETVTKNLQDKGYDGVVIKFCVLV